MSEELPENQHFESECEVFKNILDKMFDGVVPTEKNKKDALTLIYRTEMYNLPAEETEEQREYRLYNGLGY